MNIILMGIQGSGKGTQAKLLSRKDNLHHIDVGSLFRKHIKNKTKLGLNVKKYIDRGELVPDKYVLKMVSKTLDEYDGAFVLDGFPRNIVQAKFLLKNYQITRVIFLKLDDRIALKRLMARRVCEDCKADYNILFKKPEKYGVCDKCGGKLVRRSDDNEKAIKKRLEKYHAETKPLIKLFKKKNLLITINADKTIDKINNEIRTKLGLK